FEREKVEDFKAGVETFLEGCVEAQKELIELWETYLDQLDADEDGPPAAVASGVRASAAGQGTDGSAADGDGEEGKSEARKRREAATARLEAERVEEEGEEHEGRLSGTTARGSEEGGVGRESEETAREEEEIGA
ncbi:Vacuolar protein sorting-associated protein vps5, partial [Teratosphaeriaceae sp. CCFEE 6253]